MGPTHWLPASLQWFLGNPSHLEGKGAWEGGGTGPPQSDLSLQRYNSRWLRPTTHFLNKHEEGYKLKVTAPKRSTEIAQLWGFDQATCVGLSMLLGEQELKGLPSSCYEYQRIPIRNVCHSLAHHGPVINVCGKEMSLNKALMSYLFGGLLIQAFTKFDSSL